MTPTLPARFEIGEFEIEPPSRRLRRRDGALVHIANRPFQVLIYLIIHRDRLVTRAELIDQFWEGREVYDDSLTRCLSSIRRALDDRGQTARYIETLWAQGYRYIGPIALPGGGASHSTDPFAAQGRLAHDAARQLPRGLLPHQFPAPRRRPATTRIEAHDHYIQGRCLWDRGDAKSLLAAIEHFESAVRIDPQYARAYVGLAEAHVLRPAFGLASAAQAFPQARSAAREALALDAGLAGAQATLALISAQYSYDAAAAEQEFQRALSLDANDAIVHRWYADLLCRQGRFDEAVTELREAHELDPTSRMIATLVGWPALWRRDYACAAHHYRKVLELYPEFPLASQLLGRALTGLGEYEEAIAHHNRSLVALGVNAAAPPLIHAHVLAGQRDAASQLLRELAAEVEKGRATPDALGLAYAVLGRAGQALTLLEYACVRRDSWLTMLGVDPCVDALREEPRFVRLLARVGLRGAW